VQVFSRPIYGTGPAAPLTAHELGVESSDMGFPAKLGRAARTCAHVTSALRRPLIIGSLCLFFLIGLVVPMLHVMVGALTFDVTGKFSPVFYIIPASVILGAIGAYRSRRQGLRMILVTAAWAIAGGFAGLCLGAVVSGRVGLGLFGYVISPMLIVWTLVAALVGGAAGAVRARLRALSTEELWRSSVSFAFYGAVAGYLVGLVTSSGTVQQECLKNSALLGVAATALTTVISLPLAYAAARYRFRGKTLLMGLVLVPMILPPFVGAIGMRRVLGRFGVLNLLMMHLGMLDSPIDFLGGMRFWGVALLEALHLYPIMFLNLTAAFANIDPAMEEAAESLGDSGLGLFRRVTLPLLLPGLFAGGSIVFVWAFTDLGTPLIFEYHRVASKQIFDFVGEQVLNPVGYALVVVVLATSAVMFLAARRVLGSRSTAMLSRGATSRPEIEPPAPVKALVYVGFAGVAAVALMPHASVILTAFTDEWFMTVLPSSYTLAYMSEAIGDPHTGGSIGISLQLALASTVLDVGLGVGIAWYVTRSRSRLAPIVDAVAMAPLAIPGVVIAFGYVSAYSGIFEGYAGKGGFWGILADAFWYVTPQNNPIILLVLAYSVRRLPYMVRAAAAGFQQTSVELEEASLNLGAGHGATMRRITLPLIGANIIAGAVLAFSFAMLEVSDSLVLAMKENYYPLTKQIYHLFGRLGDGPMMASALGVIGMVILAGSLMVASSFMGKRLGQMFRIG